MRKRNDTPDGIGRTPARVARLAGVTASVAVVGAVALATSQHAAAQSVQPQSAPLEDSAAPAAGQISPFPEADVYRLQVYGDDFGEGLHEALVESVKDPRIQVQRQLKHIGALIRPEWEDDLKGEETSREQVHIAVLMFGLSDRQVIRPQPGARPLAIGSPEWRTEYGRRVERWLKALRGRNIVVYLVGQPVLRRQDAQRDAEMLNEILRDKAYISGVRFIDIMETFQEEGGGFSQFGPDLSGNRQKLRDGDGVTFTQAGNRKLSHFVEREVKRDVTQAIAERAVPLAGTEVEQKRINPGKVVGAQPVTTAWKSAVTIASPRNRTAAATTAAAQVSAPAAPVDGSLDQKADNGRLVLKTAAAGGREETITIDIVRPAIPAAVVSLLARKEAGERNTQPGEPLIEMLSNGSTVISAVSTLGEASGAAQRQKRASGSQASVYVVLIKGERLPPKPGRADDFTWPRPETAAVAVPAPPPPAPRSIPAATGRQPAGAAIPRASLPPPGQPAGSNQKGAAPATPQASPRPQQR